MNDSERCEMVQNDEPLYRLWKSSKRALGVWVVENRALIDGYIKVLLQSPKQGGRNEVR